MTVATLPAFETSWLGGEVDQLQLPAFQQELSFDENETSALVRVSLLEPPRPDPNAWGVDLRDRTSRGVAASLLMPSPGLVLGRQSAAWSAHQIHPAGPASWLDSSDGSAVMVVVPPVVAVLRTRDQTIDLAWDEQEAQVVLECHNCSGVNITGYLRAYSPSGLEEGVHYQGLDYGFSITFEADAEEEAIRRGTQETDVKTMTLRVPFDMQTSAKTGRLVVVLSAHVCIQYPSPDMPCKPE